MKALLFVNHGTSTEMLNQISAALKAALPSLSLVWERRDIKRDCYNLKVTPSDSELENRVATIIEEAVSKSGSTWTRTWEKPSTGCRYPRPLKETAEAYRRAEEADARVESLIRAGIDPMEHLLSQEGRMNPAVRRPAGYPPGGFLPIDNE